MKIKTVVVKVNLILNLIVISSSLVHGQNSEANNRFIVNGKLTGRDTGSITLFYINNLGERIADTAYLRNGNFTFSGYINEPTFAKLLGNSTTKASKKANTLAIYLEPKFIEVDLVENDFSKAVIKGSKTQNEKELLEKEKAIVNSKLENSEKEYDGKQAFLKNQNGNIAIEKQIEALELQIANYKQEVKNIELSFVATHPNSYVSASLMGFYLSRLPLDSIKMFYLSFSSSVKNSFDGKEIKQFIDGSPGANARDFSTTDMNGNLITLSSFKDKNIVLLDFWATWCVPCRSNNPHLIELYNKYHVKGLEVIGIANDDNRKELWNKAISDDKTNVWHQVLQGYESENDLGKKFGVKPIPTKILIDKNGIIVYRHEGNNDNLLDKKLAELFE